MKIARTAILIPFALLASPALAGDAFSSFSTETKRIGEAVQCPSPKVSPAGSGWGALYGCIFGKAQTAKLFINESAEHVNAVETVKVMWNDWFKDVAGDGVHADQADAAKVLETVAGLYAPNSKAKLIAAFFGMGATSLSDGQYNLEVRVTRGPAIDERLLIVRQK